MQVCTRLFPLANVNTLKANAVMVCLPEEALPHGWLSTLSRPCDPPHCAPLLCRPNAPGLWFTCYFQLNSCSRSCPLAEHAHVLPIDLTVITLGCPQTCVLCVTSFDTAGSCSSPVHMWFWSEWGQSNFKQAVWALEEQTFWDFQSLVH